jgi:hypothetical protein
MTITTTSEEIYGDSEELRGPREARGGAIAPADIPLLKKALYVYVQTLADDHEDVSQIANLLHRLGRIA